MRKFAVGIGIFAVVASIFAGGNGKPKSFAFDKTFPDDGTAWEFTVVQDKDSTALAELEAKALDTLEMSPMFRCQSGIFGVRWIGKPLFSSLRGPLLRIYKLVLQDASPPDEDTFIIRHQILGWNVPLALRHDRFWCAAKKNKDGVCTVWDSEGYVSPKVTSKLTDGATSDPIYKQKLKMVPNSNVTPKTCPLTESAWWCLWILCPSKSPV